MNIYRGVAKKSNNRYAYTPAPFHCMFLKIHVEKCFFFLSFWGLLLGLHSLSPSKPFSFTLRLRFTPLALI